MVIHLKAPYRGGIHSKAPYRVSFGGGSTDMKPYCEEHGGCVVSTTIDRYVYITLKPRKDKKICVYSVNYNDKKIFNIGDKDYDDGFELFKGTVNYLNIKDGFDIVTYSELPAGSGMGGSSSLSVALIGAFDKFYNFNFSTHDIAQKACFIERVELNQKGGFQDQFAAAFGGFNFIEFTDSVKLTPIQANKDMLNELHYRLILYYIGGSHFSSDIQKDLLSKYRIKEKSFMKSMQELKSIALSMKSIVESNNISNLNQFGELLHKGWLAKKRLSSKISNENIEKFYLTSRNHGALGGKLLGAGGAGHLLLFSKPDKKYQIIQELEKIGGKIVNFHFNSKGLEVWKINN